MFSVNLYGSHPDAGNDDCWTGEDFPDEATARATFRDPTRTFSERQVAEAAFFLLDGPGVHEVRENPAYVPPPPDTRDDWEHEAAMQAGMAFGVAGYNDAKGY